MKKLKEFELTNSLLDKVHGGNGATPVHFEGENAVEQAAAMADCWCWCTCGWSGSGRGTGWISLEKDVAMAP